MESSPQPRHFPEKLDQIPWFFSIEGSTAAWMLLWYGWLESYPQSNDVFGAMSPCLHVSNCCHGRYLFAPKPNIIMVYTFTTCEVAPKFNCCKMEYLFILRFKGPLRFSMFRTCLSRKPAWPCVFLSGLRDFSCRAPFWRPCTFACVPVNFFNRFLSLRCSTVTLRGGSACMFLRLIGLNEVTPCKSEKSWNCLRFLLRFAFGLGKVNKTENPSI